MFCSSCFQDNEEGLERCASCGEVLLPPLPSGSSRAAEAPGSEAAPRRPPAPEPGERPAPAGSALVDPAAGATADPPPAAAAHPPATPPDPGAPPPAKRERRTYPRLEIPVSLLLRQPATDGHERREERTIAENIGRGGMRVMTTWKDLAEGQQVLVSEVDGDFETRAEVRGSWIGDDRVPRLNLHFLDREAPDRLVGTGSAPDGVAAAGSGADPAAGERPSGAGNRPPAGEAPPVAPSGAPATDNGPPPIDDGGASADEIAERQALRDEVLSTFQSLPTISHYELLAVPRDADTAAIRAAYARRARRFHPDRATRDLTGLREAFQTILVKLGEAREVLEDQGRRRYYDAHLPAASGPAAEREAASTPAASPPAASTPAADGAAGGPGHNSEDDALRAEKVIAHARKLFEAEKYWDTIQLLEQAMPQVQSEKLKLTMRILWARATAKNPKWLRRAEEALLEVIKDHAAHVEAHFELGQIYTAGGLTTRAQRMYRRVLELDASHQGAAAALNSLLTTRKL